MVVWVLVLLLLIDLEGEVLPNDIDTLPYLVVAKQGIS